MAKPSTPPLSFERLVTAIGQAHAELAAQASRAVNTSLTLTGKAIADRAAWRDDERRWCRKGKLPKPGWWE